MVKTIFKETCIMLLLCVVIALVLGVVFYEYIPTNKAIPNKLEAYTTPNNIQEEIDEEIIEMTQENITYTITGADLDLYKQTNSYTTGKPDPFAAAVTSVEEGNNATGNNGAGGTSQSNGTTTKPTDPNSTGTFYNNTGLK